MTRRALPERLVPLQPTLDALAELLCDATLDAACSKPRAKRRVLLLRRQPAPTATDDGEGPQLEIKRAT